MLIIAIFFILSFFGMEFIAWVTHKYIMHGFLWNLHKDHHTNNHRTLEHNDWFSFIFAIPSFLLIFSGLSNHFYISVAIGAGMAFYGFIYFIVHDVFIHQRIKLLKNSENYYLKALRRAHKIHHKSVDKEKGESFGFLIVNKKYFQEQHNSLFDKTHR